MKKTLLLTAILFFTGIVNLYALTTPVNTGNTVTGETIASGQTQDVNGGTTISGTIQSGGTQNVNANGNSNLTTVDVDGTLNVNTGGTASTGTVNGHLNNFGTSNNMTISGVDAYEDVFSGGVSNGAQIINNGDQYIKSGGIANAAQVGVGGAQEIQSGGTANNSVARGTSGPGNDAIIDVRNLGISNNAQINEYSYMYVDANGLANTTTVNSGGHLEVRLGGEAVGSIVSGNMSTFNEGYIDVFGVSSGSNINTSGRVIV